MARPIPLATMLASAALLLAGCTAEPAPTETPAATTAAADAAPLPTSGATTTRSPSGSGSPTGGTCGGIAGQICASAADYCKEPDGQCKSAADGQGTCTAKPEGCTEQYDPVCGCDGKTHGNACTAAAAGVSVAAKGECTAAAG